MDLDTTLQKDYNNNAYQVSLKCGNLGILMTIDQMIERLRTIGKWNSEHGFGNRGLCSASVDAKELEKAYELVSMAYEKVLSWEDSYRYFFITKTMETNPKLAEAHEELWTKVKKGWLRTGPDFNHLYWVCTRHSDLEPLEDLDQLVHPHLKNLKRR